MKKLFVSLGIIFALLLLFGCTISVNPQDLAPSRNYSLVTDTNTGTNLLDNNSSPNNSTNISLTASEVAKHSANGNCWMIINGNVYDLSSYVSHPGGSIYLNYCGKDATQGYDTKGGRGNMHSSYANALLANYLIGKVGQQVTTNNSTTPTNAPANNNQSPPAQQSGRGDEYWDD
ncbi:MAG: cytochrome b5-like heme/steroid binding domain-containing protein [Candidatus Diapherotrites archaeon]|nr:cytochrome b5-like heme/steroid binding domain-containing protein [Candidatus Diapherotrites archaeon]